MRWGSRKCGSYLLGLWHSLDCGKLPLSVRKVGPRLLCVCRAPRDVAKVQSPPPDNRILSPTRHKTNLFPRPGGRNLSSPPPRTNPSQQMRPVATCIPKGRNQNARLKQESTAGRNTKHEALRRERRARQGSEGACVTCPTPNPCGTPIARQFKECTESPSPLMKINVPSTDYAQCRMDLSP